MFHTSTERLGLGSFALAAGETFRCTFQVDLHLARGTFHLGAIVCRYDIQREYDYWCPAASLFITTDRDVGGAANLYPRSWPTEPHPPQVAFAGAAAGSP